MAKRDPHSINLAIVSSVLMLISAQSSNAASLALICKKLIGFQPTYYKQIQLHDGLSTHVVEMIEHDLIQNGKKFIPGVIPNWNMVRKDIKAEKTLLLDSIIKSAALVKTGDLTSAVSAFSVLSTKPHSIFETAEDSSVNNIFDESLLNDGLKLELELNNAERDRARLEHLSADAKDRIRIIVNPTPMIRTGAEVISVFERRLDASSGAKLVRLGHYLMLLEEWLHGLQALNEALTGRLQVSKLFSKKTVLQSLTDGEWAEFREAEGRDLFVHLSPPELDVYAAMIELVGKENVPIWVSTRRHYGRQFVDRRLR